jgi:hypothetical protein
MPPIKPLCHVPACAPQTHTEPLHDVHVPARAPQANPEPLHDVHVHARAPQAHPEYEPVPVPGEPHSLAIHFRNTREADLPGGGINAILSWQVDPAGCLDRQSCEIAR